MERQNKARRRGKKAASRAEGLGTEPASTSGPKEKTQDPRAGAGAQRHGSSVALANVARERAAHADEKKKDGAPSPGSAAKDILRRKGVRSSVRRSTQPPV